MEVVFLFAGHNFFLFLTGDIITTETKRLTR